MIEFYNLQDGGTPQLTGSYNFVFVTVSYLVATVAAYAGLRLGNYARRENRYNWSWLAIGSMTMGIGVWAMHFIGMLAFSLPLPVSYNLDITIVSVLPSIIGCSVALTLLNHPAYRVDHVHRILAGIAMGLGIGMMHYTGMAAMQMDARMFYDRDWFLLSLVTAVSLGIIGMYAELLRTVRIADWLRTPFQISSAAILGLAVCGMHYVAMQATVWIPSGSEASSIDQSLSPAWLSTGVSVASVVIAILAVIAAKVNSSIQSAHKMIRVTRERIMAALESISDGFLLFDEKGKLVLSNAVISGMYPSLKDVLVQGTPYESVLRAWTTERNQFPNQMDKEIYIQKCLDAFEQNISPMNEATDEDQLSDGRWAVVRQNPIKVGGMVSVWSDVTLLKQQQSFYRQMALTDALTGLPNRMAYNQHLNKALKLANRSKLRVALMFIDLDRFKPINDTHGHDAGDHVLVTISTRLLKSLRETDFIARIGGDEFVIIIEQITTLDEVKIVAKKILALIQDPIEFNGHDCSVGASIGVSLFPDHATDEDTLTQNADKAMYAAKEAGRNNIRFYSP